MLPSGASLANVTKGAVLPVLRYFAWRLGLRGKLFADAGIFGDQVVSVGRVECVSVERCVKVCVVAVVCKGCNGPSWPCLALLGPARPRLLAHHEPPCFAMCVQNFTPNFEINFGSHCIILLNLHINQGILIRVHP